MGDDEKSRARLAGDWTNLTDDLSTHPSHKDFVIVEIDGVQKGADYLYCQFSDGDGSIIDEGTISRWRLMTSEEVAAW